MKKPSNATTNSDVSMAKAHIAASAPKDKTRSDGESKSNDAGGGGFSALSKLRRASKRPLPLEYGNGQYRSQDTRPTLRHDVGTLSLYDFKTLYAIVKSKLKRSKIVDDKTMIMERTIQLVAGLPDKSPTREKLTNSLIAQLWNSLEHPPMLYVGQEYAYRKADGSNNNPMFPRLGAAGSTYSRSCKPRVKSLGALPDPNLIFESLMMRGEFKKHPNNVSSILWYWATIIIHDLFWTDLSNPNMNKSSSYLDLAPLYGNSDEMVRSVRTMQGGKLKADSFADKRLIGAPPGVCVLLIMFNRFHNQITDQLAAINENGRFTPPTQIPDLDEEATKKAWIKYDEDLFQTARLVTSGLYMNITLIDYVRNIVNLNRSDTTWTLDPRQEAGVDMGTAEGAESGVGNAVSAEFNLCYRWHSCISERDDAWVQQFYGKIFGGAHEGPPSQRDPKRKPNPGDMLKKFKEWEASIPQDPLDRVFGDFERGEDGKFSDDKLVKCITEAIDDVAGAFGARNVPPIMRHIEIMGIVRGRKWQLAGLNEFRKHFGLMPYARFEDINSDPAVAEQLRRLYEHPDNVELYPGLVSEEAKTPMVPGVGIAPTYTISRVVLSDAVALVRGDRHYTTDYTPRNLTAWGYGEVDYDLKVNHGCVFYKLFLRVFPNHFTPNSVYAHYPMVIKDENRKILESLGRDHLFDFDLPKFTKPRINITSYGAAKYILENKDTYRVTWHEGLSFLMGAGGKRFMLAGDSEDHSGQRQCMHAQLYKDGWMDAVRRFYAQTTEQLLNEKSFAIGSARSTSRAVDLVRDVGNMVHTHFAARVFNLPLKTAHNPRGVFAEHELYGILAAIFTCIFFDMDPAKSFPLRQGAREVTLPLGKLIETNVKLTRMFGIRGLFTGKAIKDDPLAMYGVNMIKGLAKSGMSNYDIAWSHVLPTAGAMVPNQAQVLAQAIDFYLDPARAPLVAQIAAAAALEPSETSNALLLGYAMEGIRLAGTFGSYREAARADTIEEDDGRRVPVKAGERVFVSFVSAARDPARFPRPDEIDPHRPLASYIHYGFGPHACLGRDASQVALTEIFRVVFRKKNLRRVPGPQGELKKVPRPGGFFVYMREDWSGLWPFPTTMKVMWDE